MTIPSFQQGEQISQTPSVGEIFDQRTAQLFETYCPGWKPEIVHFEGSFSITLPGDEDAEYRFELWEFGGEKQIVGKRTEYEAKEYFYCYPFELAGFRDDVSLLNDKFNTKLEIILANDTRIRQRNGVLFATFRCEYRYGTTWKKLGGASAFRWSNFNFPPAPLYRDVYYRGPKGRSRSA